MWAGRDCDHPSWVPVRVGLMASLCWSTDRDRHELKMFVEGCFTSLERLCGRGRMTRWSSVSSGETGDARSPGGLHPIPDVLKTINHCWSIRPAS